MFNIRPRVLYGSIPPSRGEERLGVLNNLGIFTSGVGIRDLPVKDFNAGVTSCSASNYYGSQGKCRPAVCMYGYTYLFGHNIQHAYMISISTDRAVANNEVCHYTWDNRKNHYFREGKRDGTTSKIEKPVTGKHRDLH